MDFGWSYRFIVPGKWDVDQLTLLPTKAQKACFRSITVRRLGIGPITPWWSVSCVAISK
ncbi:hypothetical protein EMIT0324P_290001 [Pseudomonas chlororaphis]